MAIKGRPFKKGNPGGPGRKKMPPDLLGVKALTKDEFTRRVSLIMEMPIHKIKDLISDPSTPSMDLMLGRIVFKAIERGDQQRLDFLLNRLIGKVMNHVQVDRSPEELRVLEKYNELKSLPEDKLREIANGAPLNNDDVFSY